MEAAPERDASLRAVLVLASTAFVLYAADQLTKAAVVATLPIGARVDVIGDLVQLWHAQNTGAAFSLFRGELWLFFAVSALALVMVTYFHLSLRGRSLWLQAILGMILAGTLGNLTDRLLRQGSVVDFVSVGIGDLRWPTFNMADSSIVVGIVLLVAYLTFSDRRSSADAA